MKVWIYSKSHGPRLLLLDDQDAHYYFAHTWHLTAGRHTLYVKRTFQRPGFKKNIALHREIVGAIGPVIVDHINGNGLDNRRANLRVCRHRENLRNQPPRGERTSQYKGVYWVPSRKKWAVTMNVNGKTKAFGRYRSEQEAALAYNRAAKKYHGDFAWLNPVEE
jgi:hypothetical protein